MNRVILSSLAGLSCFVIGCSNCENIHSNYERGNVTGVISNCIDLGKQIINNRQKVQKTIEQCSDNSEERGQNSSELVDSSQNAAFLQLGGATVSIGDIAEACETCAGAAAICAAVGAPLPPEADALESACCQVATN